MTRFDQSIAEIALAGGGRIGIAPLPGLNGALEVDLTRIANWGADVIVSLTEGGEMTRLGAGGLGALCQGMGLGWVHLPIPDYGIPDEERMAAWPDIALDLHATLDRGGAILLHCRGGLGRSGMIALRLMVDRKEAPDSALTRLRTARPGAVETQAQLDWAMAGRGR